MAVTVMEYKYKCRLCGGVYRSGTIPLKNAGDEMVAAILGKGSIMMLSIHNCSPDSRGVSDFIGMEKPR